MGVSGDGGVGDGGEGLGGADGAVSRSPASSSLMRFEEPSLSFLLLRFLLLDPRLIRLFFNLRSLLALDLLFFFCTGEFSNEDWIQLSIDSSAPATPIEQSTIWGGCIQSVV